MAKGRRATQGDTLTRLTAIFRQCFDDESIVLRPDMKARDIPSWDSAKMVMLILAVEESFDVRFRSREIDALRSVGDWVRLIDVRTSSGLSQS
jgi:acyl carrier protein